VARLSRKEEFALERALLLAEWMVSGPIDLADFPEERILIAQAAVKGLKAQLKQSGRPTKFAHLVLGEEAQDLVDIFGMTPEEARKHVLARYPKATYAQIKEQHRQVLSRNKPPEVSGG